VVVWCSYCQRFCGECAPFDDSRISHSICAACAALPTEHLSARVTSIQPIVDFMADLWRLGFRGGGAGLSEVTERARALNVTSSDLLVGLLTPLLSTLGREWAKGSVSIADEHRFTAFFEGVVHEIRATEPGFDSHVDVGQPNILLANCAGNSHTLGLRIAELWLAERGITSRVLVPGLPADEIVNVATRISPSVVGISVSMPEQIPELRIVVSRLAQALPDCPIVVGGYAVKSEAVKSEDVPGARLVPQLLDLTAHLSDISLHGARSR
jgi:methanogenic corrinoid protein MtbC1